MRALGSVLNFAVLAAILSLGYSGIVMSRHLFAFLPIRKGMALARVMHLSGSYWGFVLMSLHLGLHWGMVIGIYLHDGTVGIYRLLCVKSAWANVG